MPHRVRDTCRLHLLRIHERQRRPAFAFANRAVEARATAGVAGCPRLLDLDPHRVLVAVHPHLDHALGVAGGLALAPQRIARAAEIPGVAAFDCPAQRLAFMCATISTSPLAASVATQVTRPAASNLGWNFSACSRSLLSGEWDTVGLAN